MPRKRRPPRRKHLLATRKAVTHKVTITDPIAGPFDLYIIVGFYEDGLPGEVFVKVAKEGSTLHGLMDAICIEASLLLQYGVPLAQIAGKLTGVKFVPEGTTDNPDIPTCLSITDYMFSWIMKEYGA